MFQLKAGTSAPSIWLSRKGWNLTSFHWLLPDGEWIKD